MLSTFLLATLMGCGADTPQPQVQPKPQAPQGQAQRKAPVKAKAKTGNMVPGKGKAPARGKAKARPGAPRPGAAPLPPPIGAAGPIQATLVLEVKETEVAPTQVPPAPAPAPGAEGEAPPPPPEKVIKKTSNAMLKLAWGEGKTAEAQLGTVDGVCTSVTPVSVGPEGRERVPLWTVACDHEGATSELYILQVATVLAVVRGTPTGVEAKPMAYKPVRRVRLVAGATLERVD